LKGEAYLFKLENVKVTGILNIENLTIPDKTITCILGPSGSGKSTLLRLLNNLVSPDSGELWYKEQAIMEINPIQLRRRIVMVPQTPVIFDGTVKENLLIGSAFSEKDPPSSHELEEAIQMCLLKKDLKESADHLSGGEKQRLSLARAILMKPEVFLLDEPSSALDEETAHIVIQRMVEHVKCHSQTLIMVTHDKEIANMVSDNHIEITKYSVVQ
jgi:putative ABC transport system ATP-binding protein